MEHGGTLTGQTGLLFPTSILTISPSQTVTLRKAALAQPMSAIHVEAVKDKGVAVVPCFQSYLISQWPLHIADIALNFVVNCGCLCMARS